MSSKDSSISNMRRRYTPTPLATWVHRFVDEIDSDESVDEDRLSRRYLFGNDQRSGGRSLLGDDVTASSIPSS